MKTSRVFGVKLANNLDLIFGILGFNLGVWVVSLYYLINLNQKDIGFTILFSCLIYIVYRNKFKEMPFINSGNNKFKLLLNLLFFGIFLISLFVYRMQLYYRPLLYFVLICLLVAILAIEILYFKDGERAYPILVKIFLLSTQIRAGIFYNFPSLMGTDAYFHTHLARIITETGFVAPFVISSKYFYYPLTHIFISMAQILFSLDIKDALFLSIALANIFSTAGVYLIGKELDGPRTGLLATLLININNQNIVRGITNITPGSLVICYFIFVLYAVFSKKQNLRFTGFLLFATVLMVMTHQLSTFVVFMSLLLIYAAKCLHKYLYESVPGSTKNFNYILFFAITLQTYWMYTYGQSDTSFFEMIMGPLIDVLQSGSAYSSNELVVGYEYERAAIEELMLHISYLIFPFFAIGGVLSWISPKSIGDMDKFAVSFVVVILYALVYGIPLLGMRNFLTTRWFPLLAIFLSIVAASYILKIASLIDSKWTKIFIIFAILFIFSFFMITTPGINKDNPLVAKETTVRNQFKSSEIQAIKTISGVYPEKIVLDSPYISCIFYRDSSYNESNASVINRYYMESDRIDENSIFILRKSTLEEPVSISNPGHYGVNTVQTLPVEFFEKFESPGNALIYNNEKVVGYITEG